MYVLALCESPFGGVTLHGKNKALCAHVSLQCSSEAALGWKVVLNHLPCDGFLR